MINDFSKKSNSENVEVNNSVDKLLEIIIFLKNKIKSLINKTPMYYEKDFNDFLDEVSSATSNDELYLMLLKIKKETPYLIYWTREKINSNLTKHVLSLGEYWPHFTIIIKGDWNWKLTINKIEKSQYTAFWKFK